MKFFKKVDKVQKEFKLNELSIRRFSEPRKNGYSCKWWGLGRMKTRNSIKELVNNMQNYLGNKYIVNHVKECQYSLDGIRITYKPKYIK